MMTSKKQKLAPALVFGVLAAACGSEAPPSANTETASSATTGTSAGTTTGSTSGVTTGSTSDTTTGSTSGVTTGSTSDSTSGATSSTTGGTGGVNYFPMVGGAVSVYFHTSNGGWEETVTLTETSPGAFLESDSGNPGSGERNEAVLSVDAAGRVTRTSKEVYVSNVLDRSVVYSPGFVRFDPAWLDLAANESITENYDRTETPAGGTPDATRPRSHIYTSLGFETITVLDTTYNDCLVIRRERNYQDVSGTAEDQQKEFHFCPGVGKVQEYSIETGNYEQLVSYTEP